MTLQEIVNASRRKLNNYEVPYLWVDEELVYYCNEIINTICREALVLEDQLDQDACEIYLNTSTNNYALNQNIIYINSVKLVTEEVMTLDTPPATAWAASDTLTGTTSSKTCVVVSKLTDYKYVVENRSGKFTKGEVLTNGTVTAHQSSDYPIFADYKATYLHKRELRDISNASWQADVNEPTSYTVDYLTSYITVHPTPNENYVIRLAVSRYPMTAMTTASMSAQTPEISAKYHPMIVDGICSMAFMKAGEQTFDEKMSAVYTALFSKQLSDLKRKNLQYRATSRTATIHKGFI